MLKALSVLAAIVVIVVAGLAHDGAVSATSAPGKGTEIRFVLPRGDARNGERDGD